MPITLTFDITDASIQDGNDRTRVIACFQRFGWEHVGGSAWRYPAFGSESGPEDWFNHVIPALMYFRSLVEHADLDVYRFTIDAHSEAGFRATPDGPIGEQIHHAAHIPMQPTTPGYDGVLSEQRLRQFIADAANSL